MNIKRWGRGWATGLMLAVAVATAAQGDWFIARVDVNGTIRHYADNGTLIADIVLPGAPGGCWGLTMDEKGMLYTCSGGTNVWRYDGNAWTQWTSGNTHFAFWGRGLAFETNGSLHVADGDRIQQFTPSGAWITTHLFGAGQIRGVCRGLDNVLYAADVTKKIYRFNGTSWDPIITETDEVCYATADASGNVYASALGASTMKRYGYDSGTQTYSNGVSIGYVLAPAGIAWDADSRLYATSLYGDGLRKWDGVSSWPQAFPLANYTYPEGLYHGRFPPKGSVIAFH
jgi:hypothetical protein